MTARPRHLPTFACALALLAAPTAPAARADEKSHRQAAEDVLKVMGLDKQLQAGIDQMLSLQVRQNPQLAQLQPTMKQFFMKHMSWDSLKDEYITIYADAFTEDELKGIHAFYQTPAGKKMIEKTPELMAKGMQLGAKHVEENQGELRQMLQEAASKPKPKTKAEP